MSFDKGPYDAVGVAIMAELFEEGRKFYPIADEATPPKPSLFKRLMGLAKSDTNTVGRVTNTDDCDEEMSAQPCL